MDKLLEVPGVIELKSSYEAGKPEIAFVPNRKALADYGMTLQEAAMTAYIYITGYEASRYMDPVDDEEYDIFIRLREEDRNTLEKIRNLPILTPKGYLPITALLDPQSSMAPTRLLRKNKNYVIQLSMNLLPGFTSGQVMSQITKESQSYEGVPEGVSFGFGGNADMQKEMVDEFVVAILMAILLVYILLVALLESFAQPFIIMTTIPMGAIGVVISLAVTGKSLSIIAFFAIVMLIGVVVNNAILLLDEANRLLRSGTMGRRSAILNAANNKFTPIMLATVASMAAQVPLALGLGEGAETTQPMGIASIGGLAVSAILTMYLIPTFFWLPNALFHKVKKTAKKIKK
jgi:HAE1 family hydrophobic/amphiphilic exporter-1